MKRTVFITLVLWGWALADFGGDPAPSLKPITTTEGYLALLLINETPFPGEKVLPLC